MNKFNSIKSKVLSSFMLAAPLAVMAEGETVNPVQTQVVGMMNTAKTDLTALLTDALPIVGAILAAGIIIWAGFKLFRLIQKAFGFGAR